MNILHADGIKQDVNAPCVVGSYDIPKHRLPYRYELNEPINRQPMEGKKMVTH